MNNLNLFYSSLTVALKKQQVVCYFPYSNISWGILKSLAKEHFISNLERNSDFIFVNFSSRNNSPKIRVIKRHSLSGRRVYLKLKHLDLFRENSRLQILATQKGIISHQDARKLGIGGELLCTIFFQ